DEVKADLIVVGHRGLGGFKRLLLGSTSSEVVKYSNQSVLVVK
ncbi:MAG: universal stress protein, partial [Thermoanaerobaculum sp.]